MKRITGYLAVFKLLFGIYWLVLRQWLYLHYRKLTHRAGRREITAS